MFLPRVTVTTIQVLFCAAAFWLSGCKTLDFGMGKGKDEEPPDPLAQTAMKVPVGTVHLVSPGGGFVLIRSTKFMQISPGTSLTCYNAGGSESARLEVSPARKGSFLTADIRSGIPGQGDHVVMDYQTGVQRSQPDEDSDDEIQVLE